MLCSITTVWSIVVTKATIVGVPHKRLETEAGTNTRILIGKKLFLNNNVSDEVCWAANDLFEFETIHLYITVGMWNNTLTAERHGEPKYYIIVLH